jgi:hypothetical protein
LEILASRKVIYRAAFATVSTGGEINRFVRPGLPGMEITAALQWQRMPATGASIFLFLVGPTDTMTFITLGVTGFGVDGRNGSARVTLGCVSGNNLVGARWLSAP